MKKISEKKAEMLMENVVFIIIVVLFFVMMFLFLNTKSNSVSLIEEINAKKIALLLDSANKDTRIVVDVEDVYAKNKLKTGMPIIIDNVNKMVLVKMSDSTGYSYGYFSNNNVQVDESSQDGRRYLILTIN